MQNYNSLKIILRLLKALIILRSQIKKFQKLLFLLLILLIGLKPAKNCLMKSNLINNKIFLLLEKAKIKKRDRKKSIGFR